MYEYVNGAKVAPCYQRIARAEAGDQSPQVLTKM